VQLPDLLGLLVPVLEVTLFLVMAAVLWELLRLRRDVYLSQISLPRMDEIRRAENSLRETSAEALAKAQSLSEKLERLCAEAERLISEAAQPTPSEVMSEAPAEMPPPHETELQPSPPPARRGPRVLSEAGRAMYDKVLHLATRGLDADSIAREVDLTRAEVELMLGTES
jgi:lambda repressor-like predicted transcriptional regulator